MNISGNLSLTMGNSSNISIPAPQCHPPYEDSKFFVIIMYSVVLVIGMPANFLTLWLTFLQMYRKNVLAVYLFSLSLSEIMYLGTLPLWILYVKNNHEWEWGPLACKITGFIFFNNIYISILLLCCISLDRYMAVEYALESRGVRRQKIAIGVTVTIYCTVALIHSPVFNLSDGDPTGNQTTCFETLPVPSHIAHFYVARFIIGFLVPLLTLIYTNYIIKRRIETSSSFTSRQKTKVKYLAIAIIIIFMICFAPYHVALLTRGIAFFLRDQNVCDFEEKIYTVYSIFLCLVTVNSVADPFIYVLVSENVRKDICRALRVWRRQLSFNTKSDNSPFPNNHNSRDMPLDKDCSTNSGLGIIDTLQDRYYSH